MTPYRNRSRSPGKPIAMPFCPTRPKWRADRLEDGPNPTIGQAFFLLIGSVAQVVGGIHLMNRAWWGVSETLCMSVSLCDFDGSFVEPFWE